MRTIAEVLDAIIIGDLARATDLLVQRFKSREVLAAGGSSDFARQFELIPRRPLGLVSDAERLIATRGEITRARLEDVEKKGAGNR